MAMKDKSYVLRHPEPNEKKSKSRYVSVYAHLPNTTYLVRYWSVNRCKETWGSQWRRKGSKGNWEVWCKVKANNSIAAIVMAKEKWPILKQHRCNAVHCAWETPSANDPILVRLNTPKMPKLKRKTKRRAA